MWRSGLGPAWALTIETSAEQWNAEVKDFQHQLKHLFLHIETWDVVCSVPGGTAGCPREVLGAWTGNTRVSVPSFLLSLAALLNPFAAQVRRGAKSAVPKRGGHRASWAWGRACPMMYLWVSA